MHFISLIMNISFLKYFLMLNLFFICHEQVSFEVYIGALKAKKETVFIKINSLVSFLSLEAPHPLRTVYLTAEPVTAGYSTDVPVPTDNHVTKPEPKGKRSVRYAILIICNSFVVVIFLVTFFISFPLIHLSTALTCYSCQDYSGSSQPCSNPSVNQCDSNYDSCMSTVVTAKVLGMRYTMNLRNCAISQYHCNSSFPCEIVKKSLATTNADMEECSVSCCHGNLCNGQGRGGTVGCTTIFFVIVINLSGIQISYM